MNFPQPFAALERSMVVVVQRNTMRIVLAFIFAALVTSATFGRVVINEVMYHAPDDLEDLEYIELFNSGAEPVDIGGWSLAKGVKVKFGAGTKIGPKEFLVVARNGERLREFFSVAPVGVFTQKLKNDGERIELVDGGGTVMDVVHYRDRAPWALGADGHSGSLERIDADSSGDNPANWMSSPLSSDRKRPTGSPGKPNHTVAKLPPVISNVKFAGEDPAPNQTVTVEAEVKHSSDVKEVAVVYRLAGPGFEKPEAIVAMKAAGANRFTGVIPGHSKDSLVRFRIRATDASGNTRFFPAETEPRPALSYYVHDAIEPGKIPFAWIINTTAAETSKSRNNRDQFAFGPWAGNRNKQEGPFKSAFIAYDPNTRKTQVFDFVQVNPRKGGRKVHFYSDQPFDEMTGINLIFEYDERAPLNEAMAYEVYRRAGMPAEKSYHMRTWVNGQPIGYQLMVEQPNRGFLRRNKVRDDGNLYKLLWFGNGVTGQHAKKTNKREGGHRDVQDLIGKLNSTQDREQWEVIKKNFDVEEVANYFAVNMVLSYWDGFFNNYYAYHDVNGTGKWSMYPWDQDKTWGITDARSGVFYQLPLTFGMKGDKPPFGQGRDFSGWWRPPGWFSGPLLANPYFRRIFLTRVKEITENIYTEKDFLPLIDQLGARLRDDVKLRAQLNGEDPTSAMQRFEGNLNSLREHLKKRRAFLLSQKELQSIAAPAN
jgi:hypothetical protein